MCLLRVAPCVSDLFYLRHLKKSDGSDACLDSTKIDAGVDDRRRKFTGTTFSVPECWKWVIVATLLEDSGPRKYSGRDCCRSLCKSH